MATLAFKKGKEFLWAISKDKNEVYLVGKKFHKITIDETPAQTLIDSIGG